LGDDDFLYEHQQALDDSHLLQYAAALDLYAARVREDFQSGIRSGINGTPTFFINGVCYQGAYDLPSMFAFLIAAAAA
jgi:protein-disulfide isomerase